jgi:hypothetical protein
VSGVLALALKRQALSCGTVPSAVPVGHPLDRGTTGIRGTSGTVGTHGTAATAQSDCDLIDIDAIEEGVALAAHGVAACHLDAWARLQCERPLSVTGGALLRTERDSRSGEDCRAFFEERSGIVGFDGGLARLEAETRAYACCVAEWLNRNPVRSSPYSCLRCGEAEPGYDPLLPFGTETAGHAWLHSRCWSAWSAARHAEAVAALQAMGIATPAGFPNDFDKGGGA